MVDLVKENEKWVVDFSATYKIIRPQSTFDFHIARETPNQISFLLQDTEKVNRVQKITPKFRKHLTEVIHCPSLEY